MRRAQTIGDRVTPLDLDLALFQPGHGTLPEVIYVSCVAGGSLFVHRGKKAQVMGVAERGGRPIAVQVKVDGSVHYGVMKDFYTERGILEDIDTRTLSQISVQSVLNHYRKPHTYWGSLVDGWVGLLCELACITPQLSIKPEPGGVDFYVPELQPPLSTRVSVRIVSDDPYWTMLTAVSSSKTSNLPAFLGAGDHWERVARWLKAVPVASHQRTDLDRFERRWVLTQERIRPLFERQVATVVAAYNETAEAERIILPADYSLLLGDYRLKVGTVGLVEPPTDVRPYSLVSISPDALRSKDYLQQVLLHEAIHLVLQTLDGDAHGKEFQALASRSGVRKEHRK